jgi:hypothetical protein
MSETPPRATGAAVLAPWAWSAKRVVASDGHASANGLWSRTPPVPRQNRAALFDDASHRSNDAALTDAAKVGWS